ncbi:uncharacterized protein [Chironomus tepperi]
MLQSPTIMRKFIFVFESISDSLKVVKSRLMAQHLGLYIRNVKVQLEKKSSDYMEELSKFLSQLPNLESLVFEVNKSYEFKFTSTFPQFESSNDLPNSSNQVGCMFDLPNLKVLDIRYQDLKLLLNNTYSMENLQKLTLTIHEFRNETFLIDFFSLIGNLQDLSITENVNDEKQNEIYLYEDPRMIKDKIKFKLKRFELNAKSDNENFVTKFIKTQVDNLEELELHYELDEKIFGPIWSKFTKLRRLKMSYVRNTISLIEHFHEVHIDTVTSFETTRFLNLKRNVDRFPNLTTFKCIDLITTDNEFTKITNLDIGILNLTSVKGGKFPNLKSLKVNSNIEACNNEDWISFCENISNVEFVKLKCHNNSICNCCVFDCLSIFKNLKIFEYEHKMERSRNSENKENEYYKVLIDTSKQSAKVCNYIVENDFQIFTKIYKNFSNFEFIEICFEDDKSRTALIDPAIELMLRTTSLRTFLNQRAYDRDFKVCQKCYSLAELSTLHDIIDIKEEPIDQTLDLGGPSTFCDFIQAKEEPIDQMLDSPVSEIVEYDGEFIMSD